MKAYRNFLNIGNEKFQVVTINQDEGEVKVESNTRPDTIHHIEIIDRSGSMSCEINHLIDQVQKTHELIDENDIISIIWFSSPGQYRTLVKGAKKGDKLNALLDSIRSVVGCTCFCDPIKETKTIVEELASLSDAISVTLFTDGMSCSNEPAHVDEQKSIDILASFADKVIAFNTVGYGNYYNQEFLKKLAAITEYGMFAHSRNIDEYLSIFKCNFERITESKVEKVKIEFPSDVDGIYLNRKMVKNYANQIYLKKLDKKKNQFFLVKKGEGNFDFTYNGEHFSTKNIVNESPETTITNFLYAYASVKYYMNDRKTSLNIIGRTLGDIALIKSHMSSFTFDEVALHQELLNSAMLNVSSRGVQGRNTNFLPDPNEYCVIDLLNDLVECEAKYLPYHLDAQEYKRIGKEREVTDSKFVWPAKDTIEAPFSALVYNEKRANLSIRIPISGRVKLSNEDAKVIGCKYVDATIFRVHTIIKDAALNMNKLIVIVPSKYVVEIGSKTTRKFMEVIDSNYHDGLDIVCFNLKKLPLMNQNCGKDFTAEELYYEVRKLLVCESYQKVVNNQIGIYKVGETATQKKVGLFEGKTAEQLKILESYGLNSMGYYSEPKEAEKPNSECDSYETKEFAFDFVGCGNLPKISDVEKKVAEKKSLTTAENFMKVSMDELSDIAKKSGIDLSKSVKSTKEFLDNELRMTKNQIFKIRAALATAKMAKILTGETFVGFADDGKKNMVYVKEGLTLKMIMKRVTEYF